MACDPYKIWDRINDTAREFVWYVKEHPGTTHNQFFHETGKKVKSGELYRMVEYNLIVKVGKTYGDYYGNLVYKYEVNDRALKLLEKVRSAGIEPAGE